MLRLQRQVNDLQGELDETRLAIPRAEAELAEVEQRQVELAAKFRQEARAELNDVSTELNALTAGNVALQDRVRRTQVRSPIWRMRNPFHSPKGLSASTSGSRPGASDVLLNRPPDPK